jgi:hypothetical protein
MSAETLDRNKPNTMINANYRKKMISLCFQSNSQNDIFLKNYCDRQYVWFNYKINLSF